MKTFLNDLLKLNIKPGLFEQGEAKFWDDTHISKSMMESHLNPNHDAASRRPYTIDKTVQHLFKSNVLKGNMRVLDLGCGPGLYAERLCQAGAKVVGIDISKRSIEYAEKSAARAGLDIEYHCMNFLDMDYNEEFDAVIQVYGELCTFSNDMRDRFLNLIHRALKKDGVFIFDVSTRVQRMRHGLKSGWYMSEGGFWNPGMHLVLEQGYDYPEEKVWLDQYIVIDDQRMKVYRNWFHDYSLDSIKSIISAAGFKTRYVWNDLIGSDFYDGGDWIALCVEVSRD